MCPLNDSVSICLFEFCSNCSGLVFTCMFFCSLCIVPMRSNVALWEVHLDIEITRQPFEYEYCLQCLNMLWMTRLDDFCDLLVHVMFWINWRRPYAVSAFLGWNTAY